MNKNLKYTLISLILILAVALSACSGTTHVGPGTTVNGTAIPEGNYVWSFEPQTAATDVPTSTPTQTLAPRLESPTPSFTPSPTLSAALTPTGLFGSGTCSINGTTYNLQADSTAIWMDSETQQALAKYGGTCNVTTNKPGWYWSVGDGKIMHDSVLMTRGNALVATPGTWTFTYDAPAAGTTNESLGLTFRDNLPKTDESGDAFGTGTCTVSGATYAVAFDSTAVWESDELLAQLWQYGGSCTVTTSRPGWYWSTAGHITFNGQPMANGQRLVAPAGTYSFVYEAGSEANGFTIRDNVPFGQ